MSDQNENQELQYDESGNPVESARENTPAPKKKLTKQEKRKNAKEFAKQGLIPPPRTALKVIVSVFSVILAFFMGLSAIPAAFVGTGLFVGLTPLETALGLFGLDARDYVGEDYLDNTLLEVAADLISTLAKGDALTINDFRKYSPYLDTALDGVWESIAEYGITIDTETFYATPLSGMADYVTGPLAEGIEVGKLIHVSSTDSAVLAIFYGEREIDYTFDEEGNLVKLNPGRALTAKSFLDMFNGTSEYGTIQDFVFGIPLGSLLGLELVDETSYTSNAMMYTLCYGAKGVDWVVEDGHVVRTSDREPVTIQALSTRSNDVIESLPLGSMLGLDVNVESQYAGSSMMYALCYGERGVDWDVDDTTGELKLLGDKQPLTIRMLSSDTNAVLNGLSLGSMLGLSAETDYVGNELMYSLCYGSKGVDWDFVDGAVQMKEGRKAVTVGDLISRSGDVVQGMEVDALLGITPDSDTLMLYIAYGNELGKNDDGTYNFTPIYNEETQQWEYEGDGKYYFEYDAQGNKSVVMLDDPNTGLPYPKRTVGTLMQTDDLVKDLKIGDIADVGTSGILYVLRDWTISDLNDTEKLKTTLTVGDILGETDQTSGILVTLRDKTLADLENPETIENLKIGEILDVDDSALMKALADKTIKQLGDPETINSLKLGDVLDLGPDDTGVVVLMKDWCISDLQNQNRINRLRLGDFIGVGENSAKIMQTLSERRLGDFSEASTINSLKLGDVLDLEESDGLLAALSTTSIGNLSGRVDTLTLSEILGDDAVANNKLLKHLRNSTVKTLADDIAALSVGDVFADTMYSYMERTDGVTYQQLYENYAAAHATDEFAPIPKALDVDPSNVITYYTLGESDVRLTLGYFTEGGERYTDAPLYGANRKTEFGTPYYYNARNALTENSGYFVINYDATSSSELYQALPAGDEVVGEGEDLVYRTAAGKTYPIYEDAIAFYYKTEEEDRVDLEWRVISYTAEDGAVFVKNESGEWECGDSAIEVLTDENGAYYDTPVALYVKYTDGTAAYDADGVVEHYELEDGTPLDRYMSGAWFLLFGRVEEDGTVTFHTDMPILEMDGIMTDINTEFSTLYFWQLYFHGVLAENPYVELTNSYYQNGVPITRGGETVYVTNLNDIAINELTQLVKLLSGNR